jgi:hypothetical protein
MAEHFQPKLLLECKKLFTVFGKMIWKMKKRTQRHRRRTHKSIKRIQRAAEGKRRGRGTGSCTLQGGRRRRNFLLAEKMEGEKKRKRKEKEGAIIQWPQGVRLPEPRDAQVHISKPDAQLPEKRTFFFFFPHRLTTEKRKVQSVP